MAKDRAWRALSSGMKKNNRRSKQVKAAIEGKEGKTLDGVDRNEDSAGINSLKQRVE